MAGFYQWQTKAFYRQGHATFTLQVNPPTLLTWWKRDNSVFHVQVYKEWKKELGACVLGGEGGGFHGG